MNDIDRDIARERENEGLIAEYEASRIPGARIIPNAPGIDPFKDFTIRLPSGIERFYEVKFDYASQRRGNCCFEIADRGRDSGLETTKAHVWCHFCPPATLIHFPPKVMLEHLLSRYLKKENDEDRGYCWILPRLGREKTATGIICPIRTVISLKEFVDWETFVVPEYA